MWGSSIPTPILYKIKCILGRCPEFSNIVYNHTKWSDRWDDTGKSQNDSRLSWSCVSPSLLGSCFPLIFKHAQTSAITCCVVKSNVHVQISILLISQQKWTLLTTPSFLKTLSPFILRYIHVWWGPESLARFTWSWVVGALLVFLASSNTRLAPVPQPQLVLFIPSGFPAHTGTFLSIRSQPRQDFFEPLPFPTLNQVPLLLSTFKEWSPPFRVLIWICHFAFLDTIIWLMGIFPHNILGLVSAHHFNSNYKHRASYIVGAQQIFVERLKMRKK